MNPDGDRYTHVCTSKQFRSFNKKCTLIPNAKYVKVFVRSEGEARWYRYFKDEYLDEVVKSRNRIMRTCRTGAHCGVAKKFN